MFSGYTLNSLGKMANLALRDFGFFVQACDITVFAKTNSEISHIHTLHNTSYTSEKYRKVAFIFAVCMVKRMIISWNSEMFKHHTNLV